MKPFKLILSISTPIIVKEFAPTLDGLLFDAIRTRYPNFSESECLDEMKKVLAITEDVFHASSAHFVVSPDSGVVANKITRIRHSGHRQLSSDWFAPNGVRGRGYTKISPIGGKFKSRLQSHNGYGVKKVVFHGKGNVKNIGSLLKHGVMGVGFGANGAVQGQISDFVIVPVEEDLSFVFNGQINRTIPLSLSHLWAFKGGRLVESPASPPYYKGNRVECLSPEPIRYTTI